MALTSPTAEESESNFTAGTVHETVLWETLSINTVSLSFLEHLGGAAETSRIAKLRSQRRAAIFIQDYNIINYTMG